MEHRRLKPLISVIIPCYKQGQYLREAIESVLLQSYNRFEIIVVDDGSPDNSVEVVKGYSHVRYVRQNNQGVSAARNSGIRESTGDYLVFLDADDRLLPNALEAGLDCLDENPQCVFASGQIKLISPNGAVLSYPDPVCIERDHYLTLLQGNYIWAPAEVIFRRCVFESGFAYDTSRSGSADWDLYLRVSRKFAVCCHDNVVAEYRIHEGSMTTDYARMLKESLAVLHRQWNYVKGNKLYVKAYKLGITGVKESYGKPLIDQIQRRVLSADWKEAVRGASVLFRYWPVGILKYFRLHSGPS